MAKSSRFAGSDRRLIARLWRNYIVPQKGRLIAAVFFMIILSIATAAYVTLVSFLVDQTQSLSDSSDNIERAKKYAYAVLPVLLGITGLSGLSNYIQRILSNSVALNAVGNMQKQMFASTHGADYALFSKEPVGNIISKFTSDVTVISNALIRSMSNLIKDLLTIIFILGAMLWESWELTLLVVLVYPLAFWPIIVISNRLRGDARLVQEHVGRITSELNESFGGARMVKTYGMESREKNRMGKSFDERIRLYLKLVTEQARVDPILEVMGGLAIAGVLILGVYLVSAGQATPGAIAGVLTGLLVLAPRLRAVGTLNTVIQEGLASLTRIFDVIDERPTITDQSEARDLIDPRGLIEFKDVAFNYADGTQALKSISLEAKAGETIALVGASGGGKSTVMNLIPRLYEPSSGEIMIDGTNIKEVTIASLRASMALVSQSVTLFNASAADNIEFGDQTASRNDIIEAAKAADAHDFITRLPQGYDTILGEDGESLSGGQRQRIAIARAILRDAPILLLDEATSALDAESEAKVQVALDRLTHGRTTIVIAHRLSTVKKADQIYVLEDGQVIEQGSHQALSRKKGGAFAKLKDLQAH